ncbi:type II secretion system protein, partial [bacterium]|nr:type II secretion system protein [bacterium]
MAFTLAETLIVMGIIGVVVALTLPNLNSSTGDKEKVAKVKKIYSNLEDAYGRATAVYGPFDEWFKNDTTGEQINKRFGERMTEFMKVSKTCGTGDGCFSSA